jgi:hypothetical protein
MDMVVHVYNPSTQKAEQENQEFKASLVYIVRSCFKTHCQKKENKKKRKRRSETNTPVQKGVGKDCPGSMRAEYGVYPISLESPVLSTIGSSSYFVSSDFLYPHNKCVIFFVYTQ